MATLLKKLTFRLGTAQFECQLSKAEVVDEPQTEEVTTFCGVESFSTSKYNLNLGGFQDWTDVSGICDVIHTAYLAEPVDEIDFEVQLGEGASAQYRSGQCKPTADVAFGGTAGSPLTFEQTLSIVGVPAEVALA